MSIDPDDLEAFRRVVARARRCRPSTPTPSPCGAPTAASSRAAKLRRRAERRDAILADDEAVTAATATGAPGRIDDETAGLPLAPTAPAARRPARSLQARACYVCKQRYTEVDAFYHQLCPACAALNRAAATRAPT